MKKDNKLTFSAFEAVTGYSTQQLSNYKKKENQDLFRFVEEEGESFVLCTNAELREFQKRKGANTIQAEAEKTAESLETFQNSLNSLIESFENSIQRETRKAEEMQLQTLQSINNAVQKMRIDSTSVSNIADTFAKVSVDLGNVANKISEEHTEYKSYLKDLDSKYSNTNNIITSAIKTAEVIKDINTKLINTTNNYSNAISQNTIKINELTERIYNTLSSVELLKQQLEAERKENYLKRYLLPIVIPSIIIITCLIINIFSYKKITDNQIFLNEKFDTIQTSIDNIPRKK